MSDKLNRNLWGGRSRAKQIRALQHSIVHLFDRRLFEADVQASIAHCEGLAAAAILAQSESEQIVAALTTILERGRADSGYLADAAAEDVHSFVESRLVEMIGDAGRKLHTGRSRNDQVATDLRLWLREELDRLAAAMRNTQKFLLDFVEANRDAIMPGYTHLQRAQPVLFAHWCLAYFEMLAAIGSGWPRCGGVRT